MDAKKWYFSRTVWIEALQATVGFLTGVILLLEQGMSAEALGALAVGLKGLYGISLRFDTKQPIKL